MSNKSMEAWDWSKIQDLITKLPQFAAIVQELFKLFKQPKPMMASSAKCPHECEHCLEEIQKALLTALVHNAHLLSCCEDKPE